MVKIKYVLLLLTLLLVACHQNGSSTSTSPSTSATPNINYSGAISATVNNAITPTTPSNSGGSISSCSISPSLPSGLTINTSNCEISGTATATLSATSYVVTATNSIGTSSANISITVKSDLTISPTTGTITTSTGTIMFSASGGYGSYTYSVVTSGGGSFLGSTYSPPSASGTFTVKVTDADGDVATANVTYSPLTFVSKISSIITGEKYTFAATGGSPVYSFSSILGYINTSGYYSVPIHATAANDTITATDSTGTQVTTPVDVRAFQTKDTYQFVSGESSAGSGVATDGNGYIYVAGDGDDGSSERWIIREYSSSTHSWSVVDLQGSTSGYGSYAGPILINSNDIYVAGAINNIWTVRESTNAGSTWSTADNFTYSSNGQVANSIAENSSGDIYVAGSAYDTSGVQHWIVRKYTASSGTWSTVDDFTYYSGAGASSVGVDSSGNIYVVGHGLDGSIEHWLVRKSTNGGSSWATVDDYVYSSYYAVATSLVIDKSNNVYVCGYGIDSSNDPASWIVRKSADGGSTWSISEAYQYVTGKVSGPSAMATDANGNIYVDGYGDDSSGISHWLVQKSEDSGTTWTVIDDFNYAVSANSNPSGIYVDSTGTIYVTGDAPSASGGAANWITRILSP